MLCFKSPLVCSFAFFLSFQRHYTAPSWAEPLRHSHSCIVMSCIVMLLTFRDRGAAPQCMNINCDFSLLCTHAVNGLKAAEWAQFFPQLCGSDLRSALWSMQTFSLGWLAWVHLSSGLFLCTFNSNTAHCVSIKACPIRVTHAYPVLVKQSHMKVGYISKCIKINI